MTDYVLEPFGTFIVGTSNPALPLTADDMIPLVRNGLTYKIPPISFAIATPYLYEQPSDGDTLTSPAELGAYILDPATELNTLIIIVPPSPVDGAIFEIGTTQTIDLITFQPAAGQSIITAPMTLAANGGMGFRYRAANTTWYPK